KQSFFTAFFSSEGAAKEINNIEFPYKLDDKDRVTSFQMWEDLKPSNSIADDDKKARTIQVIDILLDHKIYNASLLRTTFAHYGDITDLHMITRGAFQQAFITYEDDKFIKIFKSQRWSEFLLQDSVRVLPCSLTEDERALRCEYCLKPAGLPTCLKSKEILELLKSVKTKTCFIS